MISQIPQSLRSPEIQFQGHLIVVRVFSRHVVTRGHISMFSCLNISQKVVMHWVVSSRMSEPSRPPERWLFGMVCGCHGRYLKRKCAILMLFDEMKHFQCDNKIRVSLVLKSCSYTLSALLSTLPSFHSPPPVHRCAGQCTSGTCIEI